MPCRSVLLELADGVLGKVEDGGGERGVGVAVTQHSEKCSGEPAPPEAMTGMGIARETRRRVAVEPPARRRCPLRSAEFRRRRAPPPRSPIRPPRAACPPVRCARIPAPPSTHVCVDCDNHGLAAVARRQRRDEGRVGQRGGVQADLVGARIDRCGGIGLGSDSAADCQRNEDWRATAAIVSASARRPSRVAVMSRMTTSSMPSSL